MTTVSSDPWTAFAAAFQVKERDRLIGPIFVFSVRGKF